jgi:hypothetical protein
MLEEGPREGGTHAPECQKDRGTARRRRNREVKLDEEGGHENVGCQTRQPSDAPGTQRRACDQRPAP